MGATVEVERLTMSFGRQTVWRDVTVTLPPGEVSVLVGVSASGKSVLLKSIVGLRKPERGKGLVDGVEVRSCSKDELHQVRKLCGMVFADDALLKWMTVFDNVALPVREDNTKSESEIRRTVLDKLDMTGLTGAEDKLPGEISGEMRKRAGLARALDPGIVLADEPDSLLSSDAPGVEQILSDRAPTHPHFAGEVG